MKIRCFLAIDLREDVKKTLTSLEEDVKKCEADVKLVSPDVLHFTVKFLGDVEESRIGEIKSVVEGALKGQKAFKVGLVGLGFHGSERFVRNVWVGVKKGEGREELTKLLEGINEVLERKNFRSESYPVNPHITICRTRTQGNMEALLRLVKEKETERFGEMVVQEVKLKRSELSPKGPKYSDLLVFKLAG